MKQPEPMKKRNADLILAYQAKRTTDSQEANEILLKFIRENGILIHRLLRRHFVPAAWKNKPKEGELPSLVFETVQKMADKWDPEKGEVSTYLSRWMHHLATDINRNVTGLSNDGMKWGWMYLKEANKCVDGDLEERFRASVAQELIRLEAKKCQSEALNVDIEVIRRKIGENQRKINSILETAKVAAKRLQGNETSLNTGGRGHSQSGSTLIDGIPAPDPDEPLEHSVPRDIIRFMENILKNEQLNRDVTIYKMCKGLDLTQAERKKWPQINSLPDRDDDKEEVSLRGIASVFALSKERVRQIGLRMDEKFLKKSGEDFQGWRKRVTQFMDLLYKKGS